MGLKVIKVPVVSLDETQVQRMWELYHEHYDGVEYPKFISDLKEKDVVFLGVTKDNPDEIVGFSTAQIYTHQYGDKKVDILFSGDTVLLPEYWGRNELHIRFFLHALGHRLKYPFRPFYWLLICSGYRTYLTMARNFVDHWPHFNKGLTTYYEGLIDSVASKKFGRMWDRAAGVIKLEGPQVKLKNHVAPFTKQVRSLKEIDFFMKKNPGYVNGDELAVLGSLSFKGIGFLVFRLTKRLMRSMFTSSEKTRVAEAHD